MSTLKRRSFIIVNASLSLLLLASALPSYAQSENVMVPASGLLRVETGKLDNYLISVGHIPNGVAGKYSGVFYSAQEITENRDIESIGIIAYNLSNLTSSKWGGEATVSLSETKDVSYERTGFEFGLVLHHYLLNNLNAFVGLDIRPTILSFDWNDDFVSETTSKVGLNYNLFQSVNIYGQYKISSELKSNYNLSSLSDYFQIGVSVAL